MADNNPFALMTPEFAERVKSFKQEWYERYKAISHETTPQVDGEGREVIKKRPDDKIYIEDAWMSGQLNKYFPGWSWERAGGLTFLGSEWVCADGELVIVDESLLAFGINPPLRRYWAGDSVRIQFKTCKCRYSNKNLPVINCPICNGTGSLPHTPDNIIDVGDNVQSAITGAKKRAINRLCGIGDDIYGKRVEDEGAGTYESILEANPDANAFGQWVTKLKWSWGDIMKILGVTSMSEVTDFGEAFEKVKEAKGMK